MKLAQLMEKVRADLAASGIAVRSQDIDGISPVDVDAILVSTVKAMGFEINQQNGEIYNPARDDGALSVVPMRQQAVYSNMPRRRGGRR